MSAHYLEFKFLRIQTIDLGDDKQYQVRFECREQNTPLTRQVEIGGVKTLVNRGIYPFYFMDETFKIDLQDETVYTPDPDERLSPRLRQELEDEAYRNAMEARRFNKRVRERVDLYVKQGVIEVTKDPFAVKMVAVKAEAPESKPATKPAAETAKSEKAKVDTPDSK